MKRSVRTIAIATAAVLSACSAKEAAKTDTAKVAQTGATANAGGSYDPATHTATVKATEYAFAAPDTIPAGWTSFRLVNDGAALHHMQIVRLDSGKTMADAVAAMKNPGPPPHWIVEVGGPNAPDPKSESNGTMNLAAGNYVLLCFVDIPDKVPHFTKGMIRPLTVVPSTAPSTEPTADATIALADYAFTITGALKAGHHTIKMINNGPQPHEIELIRIAPGKTMKDVGAFIAKMDGPPPMSALGGVAGVVPGQVAYFNVDLTPGNYALICFIPDAKDGKGHLEHGMIKEFKVE